MPWVARICLEFVSQKTDIGVHGSGARERGIAPHVDEKFGHGNHPTNLLNQIL
jgi:hypothetical protein